MLRWLSPHHFLYLLLAHGIEPAPKRCRLPRWSEFIKSRLDSLAATDFFSVEVWTPNGLITYFVLFVIDLASRRVEIAGVTPSPDASWMCRVARNLVDDGDGFLRGKQYLLMDRDGKYCPEFRAVLRQAGVTPIRLPPRSPNLNAFAERFARSIKEECLDRMIYFGEKMLRHAITNFVAHYHRERNHPGRGNRLLEPVEGVGQAISVSPLQPAAEGRGERDSQTFCDVVCHERLGGLLKYYERKSA